MNNWEIDVPVLIIFFARPAQLRKTFEQVRKARPSVLLLWQDGSRPGREDDRRAIRECREIVGEIDWECRVYRNYHEENMGCDPSTFYAQRWAFSIVDKCIILEDDIAVSQSFFPFCKLLLDKYENDQRINRICGMNPLGVSSECPYDYFFSEIGSVWGWASWRRVADEWDEAYRFLDDGYHMKLLEKRKNSAYYRDFVKRTQAHRQSGKPYWETIHSYNMWLNSRLNIIPTRNMVCCTGIDPNATHALPEISLLPKATRRLYYMKTYELAFPMKEPRYVLDNPIYRERSERLLGTGHPLLKAGRRAESVFLRLRAGEFASLRSAALRRITGKRAD